MQEIKKYLESRKKTLKIKLLIYKGALTLPSLFRYEKIQEIKKETERDKLEVDKISRMLEKFDQEPVKNETYSIEKDFYLLHHKLRKEIERKRETIDVADNKINARLKVNQLKHALNNLKCAIAIYESETFI